MKKLFEFTSAEEREFLKQSNFIEGVYDDRAYRDALSAWKFIKTVPKMDVYSLLRTHRILMRNQNLMPGESGAFRRVDVYIGGHPAVSPMLVPEMIDQWVQNLNTALLTPLGDPDMDEHLSKQLHVDYEHIHPFVDGNGRTGRIFMNWFRYHRGMSTLIVYENRKHEYYEWFS